MKLGKKNKKIQTFIDPLLEGYCSKLFKLDNRCKISSDLRIEGTRIHIRDGITHVSKISYINERTLVSYRNYDS